MSPTYGSRLTRIERLVASDRLAAELPPEARRTVGELWANRAQSELTASFTFSGLSRDCGEQAVPPPVAALSARAGEDERFHSRMCEIVAEHYLGSTVTLAPRADPLRFESCDRSVACGLRILLQCALNETVAAAYLRQCHAEAASPLVRAACQELLRDEIGHARIGWAYLAGADLDGRLREAFCRELPSLLTLVSAAWSKPVTEAEYPEGHGTLSLPRTREVTAATLETLVLPGLARFGIVNARA